MMKRTTNKTVMNIGTRKCMVCGHTTTNMNESKCTCGCFMYPIGYMYIPNKSGKR